MMLKKWDELPEAFKNETVKYYYEFLENKKVSLFIKRLFDVIVSAILLIVLSPIFIILAIAIKIESKGPVFYRQVRITQYGQEFKIFKFRTMVYNADKIGAQVTLGNDTRITKVGKLIRKCRLDEISQLIDVFRGTMTFVGTRPEVLKYVEQYSPEMMATLLLPAGVTSIASIYYKDEDKLLENAEDVDLIYVKEVLPGKMFYNLQGIEKFSFLTDIKIMFMTAFSVIGVKYEPDVSYTLDSTASQKKEKDLVNK